MWKTLLWPIWSETNVFLHRAEILLWIWIGFILKIRFGMNRLIWDVA